MESNQPDESINNCKFTAVRLDLRHLTSSGRHGPRSHVFVISDVTSGLEVKRMVAEKIGLLNDDDDVVSQMELIATSIKSPAKKGYAKSEYLVPDDSYLLDVNRVSPDRTVSFSLKWRNELKPSKANYMSPSFLHNVNSAPDQDLYPRLISEKPDWKPSDKISYTNGSNLPGYITRRTGNFPTAVDLGRVDNPVKRLHSSSSSTSSYRSSSDRNRNECIIHYEPQNLSSSKTDLRISNCLHSMADHPELRTTTSSRPTSYDGKLKNPRTSKSLETGIVGSPGITSTTRSSHNPHNSNNKSFIRLPTAAGSLTRSERNSLDDAVGIASSFQTFCPVVVTPAKTTSGDADQGGDQRETKFSSLPTMEQMTEAQRCRVGAQTGVSQAASSSSLPCISTTEGGLVGAGRRCLPQLCIPEEIVEEKRNLLSKKLEKKLQSADRKKKLHRRRSDMSEQRRNVAGALHSPNGRINGNEEEEEEERRRMRRGENESEDDDCKSVTSWEVAEILASADPMAPQDSDYENSPPSSTDDDNVTSVFKSTCRVTTSSPSDADTLDGSSSTEADNRDEPTKDFSPIQRYARSSAPNVQSKHDFRSHLTSEKHVASVKPVAISNKTPISADLHTTATATHNSIRVIKNPTKTNPAIIGLSLFKLLRNGDFRCRTSVLCNQSRRLSSAVRKLDHRLPFEIFNDVIQLNSALQKGSVREKFTVPVIGDSTDTSDWECLEGNIETGDIVVEVNGHVVLNRPSSEVITTCLSSPDNCLQFLLARQRRTRK